MKAALRGTEIYFDVAGMQLAPKGNDFVERPILFMLHGGPGGDHLRFKQHSLELQEVAQLIFIDHRGCGRSKKTRASDYTLQNNIADIEALRKHLGLEKINILGTSYGGMVAQGYAIRHPQHVAKLILVATAPSHHFLQQARKFVLEHGTKKQIAICQALWNGEFKNPGHVLEYFKIMDPLYSTVAKRKHKNVYAKQKTIWSYEALNEGFKHSLKHFNYIPKLKTIKSPTLILAGKTDWICQPQQAKIIAANIPNSILKIFPRCGHAIATDMHKKYISIIKKFLQSKPRKKKT